VTAVLIVCAGPAIPGLDPGPDPTGKYLAAYDPDRRGGLGEVTWTDDRAQAMVFDDLSAAMACWQQPSTVLPLRDDSRPNRPLTAYSVTFAGAAAS
jgi:hypothetical protein